MTGLQALLDQPLMIRGGWTLVHFLWQGSLIAIVLAAVRAAAGAWLQARARYALSCLALALMSLAPPVTFILLGRLDPSALPRPIWPVVEASVWERILPWTVVVWLTGAILFSARVAFGLRAAVRIRNAAVAQPPQAWQEALEGLVQRMRISAPVRLRLSPMATVPAVVGWLKPVILLPVEAVTGLPLDQLQALLAHELAHIRRNDYLVNILQSLAEALLFYHPAVWWVSGQIRAERELCCDDIAVQTSDDVLTYATALAAIETVRRARLKTAMAADGGSLLTRIRRLAGEPEVVQHNFPAPAAAWALAFLWLAGAGAVVMHASQPQPVRALRPFMAPGIAVAPQVFLDPPSLAMPRTTPLLSALLFNPFLAAPQAPAQTGAAEEDKKLASLSGSVFNTAGKPVANATLRLVPVITRAATQVVNMSAAVNSPMAGMISQTSATTPPAIARTDAEGKFSLQRVPPGSYTIQLQHKDYLLATYGSRPGVQESGTVVTLDEGRTVSSLDIKLPEPATISGRVVDEDGDPVAQVTVVAQVKRYYYPQSRGQMSASATSGDNGEFRLTVPPGRYYLVAQKRPTWSVNDRAPIPALKPGRNPQAPQATYWGGATNFKNAAPVEIGPGQNLVLGNFKMKNGPLVHVRGKVIGDPALLKGARVTRVPPPNDAICWSCGADIQADGSFDLPNMYPYEFTIGAYSQQFGFVGWQDIVVLDEDIDTVKIIATAKPLSGSVIVEDAPTGSQTPPMRGGIELTSAGYYKVSFSALIRPDGTFTFPSLAPGAYFLNVIGMPRDSYIKTARLGSRDALTGLVEWSGDDSRMEIVMSQKAPVLEGAVVDADGKPAPGTVTLVPDPQQPGHTLLYPTAKADQQGRFRFSSVAPGNYRVFAWASIPDMAHGVPDFIEPFMGTGERIELGEGSQKSLVVKRISVDAMEATLRRAGR